MVWREQVLPTLTTTAATTSTTVASAAVAITTTTTTTTSVIVTQLQTSVLFRVVVCGATAVCVEFKRRNFSGEVGDINIVLNHFISPTVFLFLSFAILSYIITNSIIISGILLLPVCFVHDNYEDVVYDIRKFCRMRANQNSSINSVQIFPGMCFAFQFTRLSTDAVGVTSSTTFNILPSSEKINMY